MPLTFGMNGDRSPRSSRQFGSGPHRKMRGIALAHEQTRVVQHGGRRADRREPATRRGLTQRQRTNARIGTEVFHPGTAREKQAVEYARRHGVR